MADLPRSGLRHRTLDLAGDILLVIGAIGILVMLGLTTVGVFWRYVLNNPIFGLQDVTSMTSAVVVACAVAFAAVANAHITVNIMPKHFGRPTRRVTDLIARGSGTAILAIAAYALIKKGSCGMACGQITGNLSIAHGPFYMILAAALAFFSLILAIQLIAGLRHWRSEDPNEPVT